MNAQNTTMTERLPKSNNLLTVFRWIVGVLFILSGLIKANDPSGLAFKMAEFFSKWGLTGLDGITLPLAIIMIAFEIIAGVAVLIGYKFRVFSFLLLLLIIFFTFLTGYAVIYEMSSGNELKCGCFGDCIPLSAWQSFAKDLILLAMIIYIFRHRHAIASKLNPKTGMITMLLVAVVSLAIQFIALMYLPYVDCLPFKKGRNMYQLYKESLNLRDSVTFTYVFDVDGKKVKKTEDEFMADSTLWALTPVETHTKVIKKAPSYAITMRAFQIVDPQQNQYQEAILSSPDAFFIFFIRDLKDLNDKNIDRIKKLYDDLDIDKKAGIITVTSEPLNLVQNYLSQKGMPDMQVLTLDEVSIKTAIRSNPGLILFQNGIIKGKWTPYNYPTGFTFEGNELIVK